MSNLTPDERAAAVLELRGLSRMQEGPGDSEIEYAQGEDEALSKAIKLALDQLREITVNIGEMHEERAQARRDLREAKKLPIKAQLMGYWTTTPSGVTAHVNGDPNASVESKKAIESVIDAAAKMLREGRRC